MRIGNVHRVGDKAVGKTVDTCSAPAAARAPFPLPRIGAAEVGRSLKPSAAAAPAAAAGMHLHTADGARKYLTAGERDGLLREAERDDRQVRTLCMTLAYAGCPRRWRLLSIASTSPPACWCSRASRSDAAGSTAPCRRPCPARDAEHGARHPRAAGPERQGTRHAAVAVEPDDRLACRACHDAGRGCRAVANRGKIRMSFYSSL